jgi:RNA polymerase sigma-70 factor, ECF subfamily
MTASDPVLELYRRVGRGLFAYARSLTGRSDQAEDLVQEVFLRVLESGRIPAAPAFLYGIVRNLGMGLLRTSAVRQKHESRLARIRSGSASADDQLLASAFAELQDLPVAQREVVVLKVFGELTFDEIGEVIGAPSGTAASRYRYGLEKLSARLSAQQEAR